MTGLKLSTRRVIYNRSDECCEICGVYAYGGSIHHRRPRGMGGSKALATSSVSNLILVCGSGTTGCHGMIEANRAESLENGRLVRQEHAPSVIPVLLAVGLVYLDDDGGYSQAAP